VAHPPRVEEKKVLTQRQGFKTNEFVVYPAHGVGQILAIEEQEIAGAKLELFVINFMKDKMTLRVPTAKVANVGMRKLSDPTLVKKALETLKGRARVKRTMWSRRAQEYEAKINSGDIVAIAEVVRDLYRSESQPEQSYSERQLYEAALDRLSREIAVVQHSTETEAIKEIARPKATSTMSMMPTATTPQSPTRRPERIHLNEYVKARSKRPGFLFSSSLFPQAERCSGISFSNSPGSHQGAPLMGACRASIHHDLDLVAHLDLGAHVEPVEDAEALHRMIDPGHAV